MSQHTHAPSSNSAATAPTGKSKYAAWGAAGFVALMLLWAGVPKFFYPEETRVMFEEGLGAGRTFATMVGLAEVSAAVLIVIPKTAIFGALLAMVVMLGAIGSHVMKLGFEGQAGMFAGLAALIFLAAGVVAWLRRGALFALVKR